LSVPVISDVRAFVSTVTFGRVFRRSCKTESALSSVLYSSTVTWFVIPARSIAASTPELPPPITATSLPENSGPSQCGQYATPLFLNSASPGTPILRQRAPVERMTDLPLTTRSEEHTSELQSR